MSRDQSATLQRLAELDADDLERHIAGALDDRESSTARSLGPWEQFIRPLHPAATPVTVGRRRPDLLRLVRCLYWPSGAPRRLRSAAWKGQGMVKTRQLGPEAKSRLARKGAAAVWRQPFIEAIQGLSGEQVIELEPEEGETLRQIRMRLAWTARELAKDIRVGETLDGTLLVWLGQPEGTRRRRTKHIQANLAR